MENTLERRAAAVIRSLMRELRLSDHYILPDGGQPYSAKQVLRELSERETAQ